MIYTVEIITTKCQMDGIHPERIECRERIHETDNALENTEVLCKLRALISCIKTLKLI